MSSGSVDRGDFIKITYEQGVGYGWQARVEDPEHPELRCTGLSSDGHLKALEEAAAEIMRQLVIARRNLVRVQKKLNLANERIFRFTDSEEPAP